MVYFPERRSARTATQWRMRKIIGIVAVAAIIATLSLIPYDILREERARLFGETLTTGLVLETAAYGAAQNDRTFTVHYKYVDGDGFAREATAPMPHDVWTHYRPGSRIKVLFVHSRPGISRVQGELEPPFQVWLRSLFD